MEIQPPSLLHPSLASLLAQASAGHNIRSAEDTNNSAATDGVWRVCNFEDPGGAWGLGATMFLRANHSFAVGGWFNHLKLVVFGGWKLSEGWLNWHWTQVDFFEKRRQFFACVVPKPVKRERDAKAQTQSKTGEESRDSLRSLE